MPDVRFATARLATGPRLHYAEQGDAGGQPVLFLHGWPDSWFTFSRVLPLLPTGIRAVVPDQRGFGESDRPEGIYSIEQFAADVVALLDALSIERAAIVGHSFGSLVGRQVAISRPDRVSQLALIGTGFSAKNAVLGEVQAGMRDFQDPVPVAFAREFQSSTAYVPLPDAFFDSIVAESMKLPARLWRAVLDAIVAYDDAAQLGQIGAPTLLIWGDHDALFPREDQDRLRAMLRDVELKIYAETGHCPNWELPEQVAADLSAFLFRSGFKTDGESAFRRT
jgi:pimeloyl-ACP methyl ester carboxylesterase